jgi:hypothetical protein
VELAASGKKTGVTVAGTANKGKTAMAARIEAVAAKLAQSNPAD